MAFRAAFSHNYYFIQSFKILSKFIGFSVSCCLNYVKEQLLFINRPCLLIKNKRKQSQICFKPTNKSVKTETRFNCKEINYNNWENPPKFLLTSFKCQPFYWFILAIKLTCYFIDIDSVYFVSQSARKMQPFDFQRLMPR